MGNQMSNFLLGLFIVLTFVFFFIAVFLGSQHLKKFYHMQDFIESSNSLVSWYYPGPKTGKGGMRNIVLHGKEPFSILVGFRLEIPLLGFSGFDHVGFASSNSNGLIVISQYLGRRPYWCQYMANTDLCNNPVTVTSTEEDQRLIPTNVYPPHWYQKHLGFYG